MRDSPGVVVHAMYHETYYVGPLIDTRRIVLGHLIVCLMKPVVGWLNIALNQEVTCWSAEHPK